MVVGRKKWGIALLCFLALVLINPKAIAADSGTCGDHLTWTIDGSGTLTISGTGDMYDTPDNEEIWRSLSVKANTLVIEPGVTSIGKNAFTLWQDLTKVTMSDSVTRIGDCAFAWCRNLGNVTFSNGLKSIGNQAFQECKITDLKLPDGLETIQYAAFLECSSLVHAKIPASVSNIGEGAFSGCTSLTDFDVDGNNPAFVAERGALFNKDKTTLHAFAANRGGSYDVPNSVTRINGRAFLSCKNLTSVSIPKSVTFVGGIPFAGCTSLTEINVADENSNYSSVDGVLFDKKHEKLLAYPGGLSGSYITPNGVKEIDGDAFSGCPSLTNVTMLNGVTSIGRNAFSNCSNLKKVVIPFSVKNIGDEYVDVFNNSVNLTDVYYNGDARQWNTVEGKGSLLPDGVTLHCRFEDVSPDKYYADAVNWAVAEGITNGTSETTFSPNNTCTTANIITFLWRANGSPEPKATNPFSDVQTGQYYAKAAVWAYENKLISGGKFNGNSPCTRAATMKYLWILSGSPSGGSNSFRDVPANADYAKAVAWAVWQGVTNGTTATTFSPNNTCTRGQIATFLLRYYMR